MTGTKVLTDDLAKQDYKETDSIAARILKLTYNSQNNQIEIGDVTQRVDELETSVYDFGEQLKELDAFVKTIPLVVANNGEAGTADLTTLKVGDINYSIPEGGGIDEIKTLFSTELEGTGNITQLGSPEIHDENGCSVYMGGNIKELLFGGSSVFFNGFGVEKSGEELFSGSFYMDVLGTIGYISGIFSKGSDMFYIGFQASKQTEPAITVKNRLIYFPDNFTSGNYFVLTRNSDGSIELPEGWDKAVPTDIKAEGNEVFLVHDTKELTPQTRLKLKTINGQSVIGDGNISAGGGEQEYIAIVMDGEITTAEGHRLTATLPEEVTYDELFNDPTKKIRLDFHFRNNHLYLYFVPALMNEGNHYLYSDIIRQGNDYFNVYVVEDQISVSWKSSVQTLEISGIDIGANETITYEIQNSDVVQSIRSIRCTTTPDENYLFGMPHKNENGKWIIQIMNLTAYSQSSQTFNVIYSEV